MLRAAAGRGCDQEDQVRGAIGGAEVDAGRNPADGEARHRDVLGAGVRQAKRLERLRELALVGVLIRVNGNK